MHVAAADARCCTSCAGPRRGMPRDHARVTIQVATGHRTAAVERCHYRDRVGACPRYSLAAERAVNQRVIDALEPSRAAILVGFQGVLSGRPYCERVGSGCR